MSRIVKLLLIALMFAVPLRSYAAGVMLLCGPDHHAGAAAAASASQHDAGDHSQGHIADAASAAGEDTTAGHGDGGMKTSVCAGCGACCTGAFALQAAEPSTRFIQASEAIAYGHDRFAGVIPENPERPPLALVR